MRRFSLLRATSNHRPTKIAMIEPLFRHPSLAVRLRLIAVLVAMMTQPGRGQAPVSNDAGNGPITAIDFVKIQPGEFLMGCSTSDNLCFNDEKPARNVRITKAFEMGTYEVTQAQWQSVMGSNPSYFKRADRPVEQVSWNDV